MAFDDSLPHSEPVPSIKASTSRSASPLLRGLGVAAFALSLGACFTDGVMGFASGPGPISPAEVYRSACMRCHDSDGRGEAVRDVFPTIPDFTHDEWHASRADRDLSRSILYGKGKSMAPMSKKLGSVEVTRMVSFIRSFQGGGLVVVDEESPSDSSEAAAEAPPPVVNPEKPRTPSGPPARPALALVVPDPTARPVNTARSPEAPTSRLAAELYRKNCLACHGKNGRGSDVRPTMSSIPDFSMRPWQTVRTNAQLVATILDGKGASMPAWRGRLSEQQARDLAAYVRGFGPAGLPVAEAPPSEFGTRFRQLKVQFDELEKQVQALSRP